MSGATDGLKSYRCEVLQATFYARTIEAAKKSAETSLKLSIKHDRIVKALEDERRRKSALNGSTKTHAKKARKPNPANIRRHEIGKTQTSTLIPPKGTMFIDLKVLPGWTRDLSGETLAFTECTLCGHKDKHRPRMLRRRKMKGCKSCNFGRGIK